MCPETRNLRARASLARRLRAGSLKSMPDCFLRSPARAEEPRVDNGLLRDRVHVLEMFLAPPTLTPPPSRASLGSHERLFKFSTEHFCRNTAVLLWKGQGTVPFCRRQARGPEQGRGPPAPRTGAKPAGCAPAPGLRTVPLHAFRDCVGWSQPCPTETAALVGFHKLSSFFS